MTQVPDRIETSLKLIRARFLERVESWLAPTSDFRNRIGHETWTEAQLDELHVQLHKFAGSARTFGYPELSEAAREAEIELERLSWGRPGAETSASRALDRFVTIGANAVLAGTNVTDLAHAERAPADPGPPPAPTDSRFHVFLADDDDLLRDLLIRTLRQDGIHLTVEADGDVALRSLEGFAHGAGRTRPDLIILDVNMPGRSGFELLRYIKGDAALSEVPVLMLTREDKDSAVLKAISGGAMDYIVKPFDVPQLRKRIIRALRLHHTQILIADDDTLLTDLISRRFRQLGFSVQTVGDGNSAITAMRRATPDLLLLDIAMPGLDGMSVLHKLKAERGLQDVPVIMLTGTGETDTVLEAFDAGAHDFVTKPIEVDELLARAQGVLKRHIAQSA